MDEFKYQIENLCNTNPEQAFHLLSEEIEKNPENENIVIQLMDISDYINNWNKTQKATFYKIIKSALKNLKLSDEKTTWELLKFWEKYALELDEEISVDAILNYYFNFIKKHPGNAYAVLFYADKCAEFKMFTDYDFINLGIDTLSVPSDIAEAWVKMIKVEMEVNLGSQKYSIKHRWQKVLFYAKQAYVSDKETTQRLIPLLMKDYADYDIAEETKQLYLDLNLAF